MEKMPKLLQEDIALFMRLHNPFMAKSEDNKILHFKTHKEAYMYVFDILHKKFQRGYVELPLLVFEVTQLKPSACKRFHYLFKSVWGSNEIRLMEYNWLCEENSFEDLRIVIKTLLIITGAQFDEQMFLAALAEFRNKLIKEGEK